MSDDRAVIGEFAVYPGHPVTLALIITKLYPSLESARARGKHFAAVEEDPRLPGAGSHNTYAVEMLIAILSGKLTFDKAMTWAANLWDRIDDQKNGGYDPKFRKSTIQRWREGQEQADRMTPALRAAIDSGWK